MEPGVHFLHLDVGFEEVIPVVTLHGLTQSHQSHLLPSDLTHKGCKFLLPDEDPFAKAQSNLYEMGSIPHVESQSVPRVLPDFSCRTGSLWLLQSPGCHV